MKQSHENALARRDAYLRQRTTAQLVEDFIFTGIMTDPHIPTVRGWIMDELERRNPEAYKHWLSLDCPEDIDLRECFLRTPSR